MYWAVEFEQFISKSLSVSEQPMIVRHAVSSFLSMSIELVPPTFLLTKLSRCARHMSGMWAFHNAIAKPSYGFPHDTVRIHNGR